MRFFHVPSRTCAGATLSLIGRALNLSVMSCHKPCEAYCGAKTTSEANRSGSALAPAAEAIFAGYSSFGYAVTCTLFLCDALYASAYCLEMDSVAARVQRVRVTPLSGVAEPDASSLPPQPATPTTSRAATVLHSHRFNGSFLSERFDLEQADRPRAALQQHPEPGGAHRRESDVVVLIHRGRVAGR